jgi:hypothetical protein
MHRPARSTSESTVLAHDADLVVDVICTRHGGIKLTAVELRGEKPHRGHLHVDHGEARLTNEPDGPGPAGHVLPPLAHAHVYRISEEAWVLYGYEHANGGPALKQAWFCTRVH